MIRFPVSFGAVDFYLLLLVYLLALVAGAIVLLTIEVVVDVIKGRKSRQKFNR